MRLAKPQLVHWILIAVALLAAGCACCNPQAKQSSPIFLTPSMKECPGLEGLRLFVFHKGMNEHENHFWAIKQKISDRDYHIWLHWSEGNRLIDFGAAPTNDPAEDAQLLLMSRSLDLKKDVVNSEEELVGSTYLVTRRWADEVLSQCHRKGMAFPVPAFTKR